MSIAERFNEAAMTQAEVTRWQEHVTIANKTRDAAFEFWRVLTVIRDERLYRSEFSTFEECCQTLWGMSRQHINSGIRSAEIAKDLETVVSIPNERTAREFTEVPKEDRPKVAEEAKAIAAENGRDKINSRDVKDAKAKVYKVETKVTEIPSDPDAEPLPTTFEPEPELADDDVDEWIKTLPLECVLQGTPLRKFVESAKMWHMFEPQIKMLAPAIRKAQNQIPRHLQSRFFLRQLSSFVIDHPKHWLSCSACKGTGQVPQVGKCSACMGDGFHTTQYVR